MDIEYEATFPAIDKNDMRKRLQAAGAQLVRPEFLQRRVNFHFPKGYDIPGGWIRVRDEGDKVTMSLKIIDGNQIEDQKEICLQVSSFDQAVVLLTTLGCKKKAFQESRRELWLLQDTEVTIDEWPFLEPFVEIEGKSKDAVKYVSEVLGFDFNQALFCGVGKLYSMKYSISQDVINNNTPKIVFSERNPFID